MYNLNDLLEGVMLKDTDDIEHLSHDYERLLLTSFQTFMADGAGAFWQGDDGTSMPGNSFLGDVGVTVVKHCNMVDPLYFHFSDDMNSIMLDHTRVPCFVETQFDNARAVRVYYNARDGFYVGVSVKYEDTVSPYNKSEATMVRVLPMGEMQKSNCFAAFWNLTRPDNEHIDTLMQINVPKH